MAAQGVILWDTDILIELLEGNADALSFYNADADTAHYYSAITYAELIRGAQNKSEVQRIRKALVPFPQLDIDQAITGSFCQLIDTYTLSHGLSIPDAFIAATALAYDMELATCNTRHFIYIAGLRPCHA